MLNKRFFLKITSVLALAIAATAPAFADATLTIAPTSSNLAATDAPQQLQFMVTSSDGSPVSVDGELLNFQINNGIAGPSITGYDIFTGTIFASPNNHDQYEEGIINSGRMAILATDSLPNAVNANGLLATLSIVAGTTPGVFTISMLGTLNSDSYFSFNGEQVNVVFPHGKISIGNADRHWTNTTGGLWDSDSNWNPFAPYTTGDQANFLGAISADSTVTLEGDRIAGAITFNNASASYTIAQGLGGGTLHLNNGLSAPTIDNLGGNHSITAPISLALSTNVSVAASSILTLGGPISGASSDLSLSGLGTLVLTGNNSYAATGIAAGSTLHVGNGSTTGTLGNGAVSNSGLLVIDRSGTATFGNAISGSGAVSLVGSGAVALAGVSNYSGLTTISSGTLQMAGGVSHTVGSIVGPGALEVETGASLISKEVRVTSLTLVGSASHTIAANSGYSKVNSVSLDHTGTGNAAVYSAVLQLNNNRLIVETQDSTDKANAILALNEAIFSGRGPGIPGTWTGTKGITSSAVAADPTHLTVGVYDNAVLHDTLNSSLHRTSWAGGSNNVDDNSILVTAALKGDANLDGLIDIADMVVIANNWNLSGRVNGISTIDMAHGDVNGDGVVDIADMVVIANNWNSTSSFSLASGMIANGTAPGLTVSQVPEPASIALLVMGGAVLFRRRRRSA